MLVIHQSVLFLCFMPEAAMGVWHIYSFNSECIHVFWYLLLTPIHTFCHIGGYNVDNCPTPLTPPYTNGKKGHIIYMYALNHLSCANSNLRLNWAYHVYFVLSLFLCDPWVTLEKYKFERSWIIQDQTLTKNLLGLKPTMFQQVTPEVRYPYTWKP